MQHADHADDRREQRHDQPESEPELAGKGVEPRLHPIEPGVYVLETGIYLLEPGVDLRKPDVYCRKPGVHLCADAVELGIELAPHCDVLAELRAKRARQPLGLPLFHSRPPQRVGHLQCVYHRLAQSPCPSVRIAVLALRGIRSRSRGL